MIIKKVENLSSIKKIFKVHPVVYFFAILFIAMGAYKEFIIVFTLIFIHECGHFLCAKVFGIKTSKIILYPLGGITKLKMDINENPIKETMILVMGPLFQFLAYFLLLQTSWNMEEIKIYHYGILIFNLLPIYPLDGGRLLHIIINGFFSYKKSLRLSIYISYIIVVLLLFMNPKQSINAILIFLFLIMLIYKEDQKRNMYFHKFLMERLLKGYSFSKKKRIRRIEDMVKYRENIIIEGNNQYHEKEYLRKKYEKF